jgi:hypothetical protein
LANTALLIVRAAIIDTKCLKYLIFPPKFIKF